MAQLAETERTHIPMNTQFWKQRNVQKDKTTVDKHNYRSMIGKLLYLATVSRPEIALATSIFSRHIEEPQQSDWEAVRKIVSYLRQTSNLRLRLATKGNLQLQGYVDADWAMDPTDRKSTSGYIFQLRTSSIQWTCRKQHSTALSPTEAELIAATSALKDCR